MTEVGTVVVDQVFLRIKPGTSEKDILGELVHGDKLKIVEHHSGKQAEWLRIRILETRSKNLVFGDSGWVAQRNYATGQKFVRVDNLDDMSQPRPAPSKTEHSIIWRIVIAVGMIVFAAFVCWVLS